MYIIMGVNIKNIKVGDIILIKSLFNRHSKLNLGSISYTDEKATHRICKGCDTIKNLNVFKHNIKKDTYAAYCDICSIKTCKYYQRKSPKPLVVDGMKQCRRCYSFKPEDNFPRKKGYCSKCASDLITEYNSNYISRLIENGINVMKCNSCKKEKDIECDYTKNSRTCKQCYKEKFQKRYYRYKKSNSK